MDEQEVRKAKRFHYPVFAIVNVLVIAVICAVIWLPRRNQNLDAEYVYDRFGSG